MVMVILKFFAKSESSKKLLLGFMAPTQMIGAIISEYLGVDTSKYPYDDLESIAHTENCILYKKD